MIFEGYSLVLEHFIFTTEDNERVRIEEPLCVQYLCDLSNGSSAYALNEVLERMKQEVLKRACHVKVEGDEEMQEAANRDAFYGEALND